MSIQFLKILIKGCKHNLNDQVELQGKGFYGKEITNFPGFLLKFRAGYHKHITKFRWEPNLNDKVKLQGKGFLRLRNSEFPGIFVDTWGRLP